MTKWTLASNGTTSDAESQKFRATANGSSVSVTNDDGSVVGSNIYPISTTGGASTVLTSASGNKANANATATLTGTSTTTVYITGFQVTASGATTGLDVTVTVTGILGGTLSYTFTFPAGALLGSNPLLVNFPLPVPASAVNVPIVVTLPAGGTGNTNATVCAQGFYL